MSGEGLDLRANFSLLTGRDPFPWQEALFHDWLAQGRIPTACDLPTGVGKTSVVALWLLALAATGKVPRRLVYVVNRRTVVDQTTEEVLRLRDRTHLIGIPDLAVSTLRGEFADNREWSADPSRPAVICGTVDMIGSRLLFGGYGVGSKGRPLHAGFLGQDVLLVHDEAHLEPAFQALVETIQSEQQRCGDFGRFEVMALTATTRGLNGAAAFTLTPADREHRIVRERIEATKQLALHEVESASMVADKVADLALERRWRPDDDGDATDANAAILVFVRSLEEVDRVYRRLADRKKGVGPDRVQQLTGTMRGRERDRLVREDPVFARFLPAASRAEDVEPTSGTVYLVCTSAGEVGIDMSAGHMVCDLSTFDSMAQRFGRVNRYGERADTRIDVVHPSSFGEKDRLAPARQATLALLRMLDGDASPRALSDFRARADLPCAIEEAFTPHPAILSATDLHFDAWAWTSIRQPIPGRQPIAPYLHGLEDWQPPETQVAWRKEVEVITGELLERYPPADLLDDYPLQPRELLRDATDRRKTGVFAQLEKIASRRPGAVVWLLDERGNVDWYPLRELVAAGKESLHGATVILPPSVGGLTPTGILDGDAGFGEQLQYDVADSPPPEDAESATPGRAYRVRIRSDEPAYGTVPARMRRVRSIELEVPPDSAEPLRWDWFEALPEGGRTADRPVLLDVHVSDVVQHASGIVARLALPTEIAEAVLVAARLHDRGKRRARFQATLGNRRYPDLLLAKSGRRGARLPEPFRHEFASVLDAGADPEFGRLDPAMRDLVLHLIASHHGRARPHFDPAEAFDPERPSADADALAAEVPRRFARLQRSYGRWGLAYLESLLRAADWAASAAPSTYADEAEIEP